MAATRKMNSTVFDDLPCCLGLLLTTFLNITCIYFITNKKLLKLNNNIIRRFRNVLKINTMKCQIRDQEYTLTMTHISPFTLLLRICACNQSNSKLIACVLCNGIRYCHLLAKLRKTHFSRMDTSSRAGRLLSLYAGGAIRRAAPKSI